MKSKYVAVLFTAVLALAGLSGCATMARSSVAIKRPDALNMRSVAVVSVYANRDITNLDDNPLASLARMVVRKETGLEKAENDHRIRIIEHARDSFVAEMSGMLGWTVGTLDQFPGGAESYRPYLDLPEFRNGLDEVQNNTAKSKELLWITASDTYLVSVTAASDPKNSAKLAELCDQLNVDAVAVIGLKLAYQKGSIGFPMPVLGERAVPKVRASIVMVGRDGSALVWTSHGGNTYFQPSRSTNMIAGMLQLNNKNEELYREALNTCSAVIVGDIAKQLRAQ